MTEDVLKLQIFVNFCYENEKKSQKSKEKTQKKKALALGFLSTGYK